MSDIHIESLNRLLDEIGEECLASMLADYACPLNTEVETFLQTKALQSQKLGSSVTYLVMHGPDILGYFTLMVKAFQFRANQISKKNQCILRRVSELDEKNGVYNAAIYLIAQIGKNFSKSLDVQIEGCSLLEAALSVLRSVQNQIGGKLVMVEREADRPQLLDFYEANGFKSWNSRADENDGVSYDQMIRVLERVA